MFRDGLLLAGYQRHEGVATLIVLLCRRKQSSTSGIVDTQVANAHQEKAFAIAHLISSSLAEGDKKKPHPEMGLFTSVIRVD